MISVSEAVRQEIHETPFLEELLEEGLINQSSLARKIRPGIERKLQKEVTESSLIMAISRLPNNPGSRTNSRLQDFVNNLGDMITRTNLMDFTFQNSQTLVVHQSEFLQAIGKNREIFCTFSQGVNETTIIVSSLGAHLVDIYFKDETLFSRKRGLSSITLKLPAENTEISGFYYFILKNLAWEGVNITEVISTTNEFTLVVSDQEIEKAFSVLLSLKKGGF
ncbi:MAG: aspartate kinase [Bacteroidales bacterium]|nr:aspartate kinase [Bacteroidales bacterium]